MYLPHYIKSPDKAAVEVNDANKLNSFGMFYVGFIARPPKMGVEPCPYFDWWMLRDVPYTPLTSLTRTIPPQTLNGGNYRPKDRRSGTALTHSSVASAGAELCIPQTKYKTTVHLCLAKNAFLLKKFTDALPQYFYFKLH